MTEATRDYLRTTFDAAADLYQAARPDYPEALFEALVALTGIRPGDRLLEIGCASGKATAPLARRGLRITCVELGPALAAAARRNLAGFPEVDVVEAAFEAWAPPPGAAPYDLVVAATSWHWIDPAARYRRAFELLRPGGHLAFWSAAHVFPAGGDPFFAEMQEVYRAIGESELLARPAPGELPEARAEIAATNLFDVVAVRHFDWELAYDAERYIRLLQTFSDHIARAPWQRERLHAEIRRRLAVRGDGTLRRHWGAALHVAQRRDAPAVDA